MGKYLQITDVMKTLGTRLRAARKTAKLTQKELATRAGVSQSCIANLESGLRAQPRQIVAIARALNMSAELLESGSDATPPTAPAPAASAVHDLNTTYLSNPPGWPFSVALADLARLPIEQRQRLDGYMRGLIDATRAAKAA